MRCISSHPLRIRLLRTKLCIHAGKYRGGRYRPKRLLMLLRSTSSERADDPARVAVRFLSGKKGLHR